MSSAARALANRANAARSTGPADTSRTRFNGLAHGLTSKQTVIPGEDQQEYDEFHAGMLRDIAPGSAIETVLAERTIAAAWRLKRFTRVESAFLTNRIDAFLEENSGSDPDSALANLFTDPGEMSRLRLFLRYQNSVQREYDTAMRELQKARAERAKQAYERAMLESMRTPAPEQPDDLQPNDAVWQPFDAPQSGTLSQSEAVGFASQTSVLASAA